MFGSFDIGQGLLVTIVVAHCADKFRSILLLHLEVVHLILDGSLQEILRRYQLVFSDPDAT